MVQRRLLTPDFVESADLSKSGEVWIADTEIRGFGLRIWSTKAGFNKALAIRTSTFQGNSVRKSFNHAWINAFDSEAPPIAAQLQAAREWARAEIKRIKTPPIKADWKKVYSRDSKRVRSIALGIAADGLLRT